jgi:hypothetical protein
MASTLSYGFIKPATGDKGSVFWPALETDIQKMNDHTHNGSNSARISAAASTAVKQDVSAAGWTLDSGIYSQTVTLPSALTSVGGTYDDYAIEIRNGSTGDRVFLQTRKVSSTSFAVDTNDNSLTLKILYT